MTIPISVGLGQRGAGGVPDFSRVENLRGIIETYEQTIADRIGFESLRCNWHDSEANARAWAREDHLGRPVEVYGPHSDKAWEGRLVEITVTIGRVKLVLSLKDMANRLIVRYSDASGGQDATATFSNALSIATWGTKDRLLSLSTTLSTAAANRAQTSLNQLAFPGNKQPSESGTGGDDDITVELRFAGWYDTLDDVLTSSTSETETETTTQATALLTAYNAVNNWFSTETSNVQASGVSDTEFIDPQTTYRDKLETLLPQGDSSHNRLHWGIFEDRELYVKTWAGATPDTITYYQDARTGLVRDAYQNQIEPWLVRPDAMALIGDIHDLEPPEGAVASMTRIYVARVTCRIDKNGVKVTLAPDNVDNLEDVLSSPTGAGPAGTSARQAAIERKTTNAARPRFSGTNGRVDLGGTGQIATGGGSILTGGGSIDTGGGSIANTGGGAVDLGTGSGIGGAGSSGVTTPGGVSGSIVKFTGSNTIDDAVANVDYAAATHASRHGNGGADEVSLDGSQITSGFVPTARLGATTPDNTKYLRGDQVWANLNANDIAAGTVQIGNGGTGATTAAGALSNLGAAPNDAKYIVQQATSELSAEQALGSLATGLLKNTTTTGVLSIATASDLPNHASRHANGGADEVALDTSQITSGTMATARLGSGTANSTTFLRGDQTWSTFSGITGSGASGRVAIWDGTSSITSDTGLTFDTTNNDLSVGRYISTQSGVDWDWGAFTSGAITANAYVTVKINGTTRYLVASDGGS